MKTVRLAAASALLLSCAIVTGCSTNSATPPVPSVARHPAVVNPLYLKLTCHQAIDHCAGGSSDRNPSANIQFAALNDTVTITPQQVGFSSFTLLSDDCNRIDDPSLVEKFVTFSPQAGQSGSSFTATSIHTKPNNALKYCSATFGGGNGLTATVNFIVGAYAVSKNTDSAPGSCPAGNPGDLRYGICNAPAGDTILFRCGNACVVTLTAPLPPITHNLTIYGQYNGSTTHIDGANSYRPFWIDSGIVTLHDLVIQNAMARGGQGGRGEDTAGGGGAGLGGCIFINEATVALNDVTFSMCQAAGGAGGTQLPPYGYFGGGGGGGGLGGPGGLAITTYPQGQSGGGGGGGVYHAGSATHNVNGANGGDGGAGGGGAVAESYGGGGGTGGAFLSYASGQNGGPGGPPGGGNGGVGGFGGGGGGGGSFYNGGKGGFGGGGGGAGGAPGWPGAGGGPAGAGGAGGGGGGGIGAAAGGALYTGSTVTGGHGQNGGNGSGGGGGAAGPAIFVYGGTLTIDNLSSATGCSANGGPGGSGAASGTADSTCVFNLGGTVNGSSTQGPVTSVLTSLARSGKHQRP